MKFKGFFVYPVCLLGTVVAVLLTVGAGTCIGAESLMHSVTMDFESGSGGWEPMGPTTLDLSAAAAHTGQRSLRVSGRSSGWMGARLDVTDIVTSGPCRVAVYVKLAEEVASAKCHLTLALTDRGGQTQYKWISPEFDVSADDWTLVSSDEYSSAAGDLSRVYVYVEVSDPMVSYYVDDAVISGADLAAIEVPTFDASLPSLKDVYADDFTIGLFGGISRRTMLDEARSGLLKKHFASISPGNAMKPGPIHPTEDRYRFEETDAIVDYAEQNGLLVRGHTLLWHSQTAEWMFTGPDGAQASRELLLQRIEDHIKTVVGRYKGRVFAWDVVNEPIDTGAPGGLRQTEYLKIIGPDYIEKAFEYAHEADPSAKLFINDYNEYEPAKRKALYELAKSLKDKGVPIHGIGMQMHIGLTYPSLHDVEEAIKLYSSLGLEIHVTEMDMSIYPNDTLKYETISESLLDEQARRYRQFFELFRKYKDSITYVAIAGLTDDESWLNTHPVTRNNWPLLFDKNLQAKPAYWGAVAPVITPGKEWTSAKAMIQGAALFYDTLDGSDDPIKLDPGDYNSDDLKALGLGGLAPAALRVMTGYRATLYGGDEWTGQSWTFIGGLSDLKAYGCDGFRSARVEEMAVTNVVAGRQAVANCSPERAYRAVDGSAMTSWSGTGEPPVVLAVDLGSDYVMNRWVVTHAGTASTALPGEVRSPFNTCDYRLQKSQDGEVWEDVDVVSGNVESLTDRSVDQFTARYVRLVVDRPTSIPGNDSFKVFEFQVYGAPAGH